MTDAECIGFLQWALPRMRMRWPGFRKVRRQVRKRLIRRLGELGLEDLGSYKEYLDDHPDEWVVLDGLCRITISRFYRDRGVFEALKNTALPALAREAKKDRGRALRCWCVGCASGEEPYTLSVIWTFDIQPSLDDGPGFEIIATDASDEMLERAKRGVYTASSLKDLPPALVDAAFERENDCFRIRDRFKSNVSFLQQDVRDSGPHGTFDLVLCRNLVFTYFDDALQRDVLTRITRRLVPGGYLIVGIHEAIPGGFHRLVRQEGIPGAYRMRDMDH